MPEAQPKPRMEGWRVSWRAAAILAIATFVLVSCSIVGARMLYGSSGAAVEATNVQAFPQPQINAHMDSDPAWSVAPDPKTAQADLQVRQAMQALAAQGDAAWGDITSSRGRAAP